MGMCEGGLVLPAGLKAWLNDLMGPPLAQTALWTCSSCWTPRKVWP